MLRMLASVVLTRFTNLELSVPSKSGLEGAGYLIVIVADYLGRSSLTETVLPSALPSQTHAFTLLSYYLPILVRIPGVSLNWMD
jgi:hypothetical protein